MDTPRLSAQDGCSLSIGTIIIVVAAPPLQRTLALVIEELLLLSKVSQQIKRKNELLSEPFISLTYRDSLDTI
jgi:hypothetical protein